MLDLKCVVNSVLSHRHGFEVWEHKVWREMPKKI